MSTAVAMKTDPELFFEDLRNSRDRVLLLDYDGTIAPFSSRRDQAYPYPTVPELLDCIMSTCRTRVALISGRSAREIPALLGVNPHPEIWGVHGLERLTCDGSYYVAPISDDTQSVLEEADAWIDQQGLGSFAEMKPGAVAVHWRGLNANEIEEVRTKAYHILWPFARRANLLLEEFDGGVELRPTNRCKADAVRTILSETGSDPAVAYLGDDTTDEDAFRFLNGRGLTALVRPMYRFTAAQVWLRPPEDVVQFLADWIRACGGDM
jgi:trehalose 6-phosphate phosphatase